MSVGGGSRHAPMFLSAALLALGLAPGSRVPSALKDDGPDRAEMERIERGYYERLLDTRAPQAIDPAPFDAGRLCLVVDDLREYVLKPGLKTEHRGASWTTNRLGMRDRDYAIAKPPGVLRVALVGDSIGSGWGVDDGLGFESLLEDSLNDPLGHDPVGRVSTRLPLSGLEEKRRVETRPTGSRTPPVEVLNFSVPGHAPGQRWEQFRRVGWPTSPDVVIFEATPADPGWDERRLRGLLARGIGRDAPQYREAIALAGARPGLDAEAYKSALRPHRWAILENVYRQAVNECQERGVLPVWVLIPRVGKPIAPGDRARLVQIAHSAGFAIAADLSSAFDGIDPRELAIAPNDFHPNARGHKILAGRIGGALDAEPLWKAAMARGGRR